MTIKTWVSGVDVAKVIKDANAFGLDTPYGIAGYVYAGLSDEEKMGLLMDFIASQVPDTSKPETPERVNPDIETR